MSAFLATTGAALILYSVPFGEFRTMALGGLCAALAAILDRRRKPKPLDLNGGKG